MTWKPEIKTAIDKLLASKEQKKIAVFDADGTLWRDDIGESFFKYQIEKNLAPGVKGIKDPWSHYKKLCATNLALGYGWLAQINEGLLEKELQNQAQYFYENFFKKQVAVELRNLISSLQKNSFEIWICSASIKWSLAPALSDLGIDLKFLIATEVTLDSETRLTQKVVEPLPYRAGKKICLEKKLSAKPLAVIGNSMGDLDMMCLAQELPLTIIFKPHLPEIKASEEEMIVEATKRGWPIQIFQR